jgi:hypothetical protein
MMYQANAKIQNHLVEPQAYRHQNELLQHLPEKAEAQTKALSQPHQVRQWWREQQA